MSIDTSLPLALHKANLELWLRTSRLLQEGRKKWLELDNGVLDENIEKTTSEINQLLGTDDWQAIFSKLPNEALWGSLQQRIEDAQALTQTVIKNQAEFNAGMQEALAAWQKESAAALGGIASAGAFQNTLNDIVRNWAGLAQSAVEKAVQSAKPAPKTGA